MRACLALLLCLIANLALADELARLAKPDPQATWVSIDPDQPGDFSHQIVAGKRWQAEQFKTVIDVGPGHTYAEPVDVPWPTLQAGTLVRIHWRAQPYRNKWSIDTRATAADPLVVMGIANADGQAPVISAHQARSPSAPHARHQGRSIIRIGSGRAEDGPLPAYIHLIGLQLRDARRNAPFTSTRGETRGYAGNAAAVHAHHGENIVIQGCVIRNNQFGVFSGSSVRNLVIAGSAFLANGERESNFHHAIYTESDGVVIQGNYLGPLTTGATGNNLKDRSARTIVRYNWIESANYQIDLVDSDHLWLSQQPGYRISHVYGNRLIEREGGGNSVVVHYGGDSGDLERYRAGVLHFYHNRLQNLRGSSLTALSLSDDRHLVLANNNLLTGAHWTLSKGGHLLGSHNLRQPGSGRQALPVSTVYPLQYQYHPRSGLVPYQAAQPPLVGSH